ALGLEAEGGEPDWLDELPLGDDPDLDSLIEKFRALSESEGDGEDGTPGSSEEQAAQLLTPLSDAAAEGAIETDRVARQLERFLPGIGWSTAPGQLELSLLERLDQLATLLESLEELKDLADHLGRLEDATEREGRSEGGREEVVGVRLGGEVATALPGELALLGDPDTEDLFYQRLLERRLVSLELTGTGDEGRAMGDRRGPVIACIDTSASMEGPPELAAKALVLAVCRKVIPKGRTVHLILFGGPGEQTEIRLRRGLGGLEGMLAFLQRSFHSGTDFDGPLLRAMDLLEEQELELADVLVVTDGLCRAGEHVVRRVDEVRASTGVRVWSVVLGHRDARGVEPFSDDVLLLDPTEAAQAAGFVRRLGRR
ncbi:MAG: VWA domain-containing protein, partial [Myxococcota bacterium]